jgi:NAD(P)-dependent dehydrogenase (short-subunit alcohol dehydrogenase family)
LERPRRFGWLATSEPSSSALAAERDWAKLASRSKAIGAEPLVLELDLTAPPAAEIVVNKTLDRFGRIDALVNIAGAVAGLDVFQMTDEQWNTGMELKFHGARRLTIHAWDALRVRPETSGRIA